MNVSATTALHALTIACLVAVGCSSGHGEEGCPELCERTAECTGSTVSEDECSSVCEKTTALVENAGCERDWESVLECRSHADNACDEKSYREECSVQYDSYTSCVTPYCQQHPSECPSSAP
jgi:hypothetical protein